MNTNKVGRNDLCKCGSGKKFKKCCAKAQQKAVDSQLISSKHFSERKECQEREREKQQGLGKPIISAELNNHRVVAIGNRLVHGKWKTFSDFLMLYFKKEVLTESWIRTETAKSQTEQHPIIELLQSAERQVKAVIKEPGKVTEIPSTGTLALLFDVSYGLYLLEHNISVQSELIRRLKEKSNFNGAFYEIIIASMLIRAGYALEFEDERDRSTKHCELTATCKRTGKKISVEAKYRQSGKSDYNMASKLRKAFNKPAHHDRLIFIELNASNKDENENENIFKQAVASIDSYAATLEKQGQPAPPAYIIITNRPYLAVPDGPLTTFAGIYGFKIADARQNPSFSSLREAYHSRQRHRHIYDLLKSIKQHSQIPTTFDGSIPELAFTDNPPRLLVGNKYPISGKNGEIIISTLMGVCINEGSKIALCIFQTPEGKNIFAPTSLTDAELTAYQKNPSTFFGKIRTFQPASNNPIDLFEGLLNSYSHNTKSHNTKEHLLKLMRDDPQISELQLLEQQELVEIYCEKQAIQMCRARK